MLPIKLNIPDSFYNEETRCGYTITHKMKKVWAVELDLLNEFAECCKKHNLTWFVHAGTMLGAIRHKGFIPWDDDIDVVMPRDDYEQFCRIAPKEFVHPYFFQNETTDQYFARNFSRLRNSETTAILDSEKPYNLPFNQGIFIDIFPMDNVPNGDAELKEFIGRLEKLCDVIQWRNLVYFYRTKTGKGIAKMVKYFVKHLLYKYVRIKQGNYRRKLDEHHQLVTMYNNQQTNRISEMIIPPLHRHIWEKRWLEQTIWIPFEMLQVPVPAHYEKCLRASYGENWVTPVKQPTMHWGVMFNPEKSYKEYLKQ